MTVPSLFFSIGKGDKKLSLILSHIYHHTYLGILDSNRNLTRLVTSTWETEYWRVQIGNIELLHIIKSNYLATATTTPEATSKHPTNWLIVNFLFKRRAENISCQTKKDCKRRIHKQYFEKSILHIMMH